MLLKKSGGWMGMGVGVHCSKCVYMIVTQKMPKHQIVINMVDADHAALAST